MKNSIVSRLSEILIKSVKHDLSYSLKYDLRSISKITFHARWKVSPTDTKYANFSKELLLGGRIGVSWMDLVKNLLILQK